MLNERLRRVTDLFVEGTELHLGTDEANAPVLLWVNKLNSFEAEEARRDGAAARGLRIAELSREDGPEYISIMSAIERWGDDELAQARVNQQSDEIYLEVLNDLEADTNWRDRIISLRRAGQLLDDESAPDDDPRRETLADEQTAYLVAIRTSQAKMQKDRLDDLSQVPRADMIKDYLEAWRNRDAINVFMEERRVHEIFCALRDCQGTEKGRSVAGKILWDHTNCNHAQRVLSERKEVRTLPEPVIAKIIDAIDEVSVPARESGNSVAPESSSASSEPSSVPEEASTVSIPEEMPLAAPTT